MRSSNIPHWLSLNKILPTTMHEHDESRKMRINLRSLVRKQASTPKTSGLEEDPTRQPQTSRAALKMRNYRMKIKADVRKCQDAKEAERLRSFMRRRCMTDEQKKRQSEASKERMRRYREKKKKKIAEATQKTSSTSCRTDPQHKPETRSTKYKNQQKMEQKRRRKTEQKRAERAKMSSYKKRWVREKNRIRMQKKREEERKRKMPKIKNPSRKPAAQIKQQATYRTAFKCLQQTQRDKKKHTNCKNTRKFFLWKFASKISKQYRVTHSISKNMGVRYKTLLKYSSLSHCPCNQKKRSDATSVHIEQNVKDFFVRPDVSSCLPNKKDVTKKLLPKYVIQSSLSSAYHKWKQENPTTKMSFRKFAMLRPSNVLTQKHTKLTQCLCEYCTNVELKLKTVSQQALIHNLHDVRITDKYHAVNLTCCGKDDKSFHKKPCVVRKCQNCGVKGLSDHLGRLLEKHGEEKVTWMKWKMTEGIGKYKHMALSSESGTLNDMAKQLLKEIAPFAQHLFTAHWQHVQFKKITDSLPANTVVCVMDFAENYTCLTQNEVQSAHWGKTQVTLHPIVAHYTCPTDGGAVRECINIVSSDLKHDSHAVSAYTSVAYDHLTKVRKLPLTRAVQFTDGCSAQYKSKTPFVDISYSKDDYSFPTERHFFGSRHGKGPCDGEGGVIKAAAERAVKSEQCSIHDAATFFEFCREHLSKPAHHDDGTCSHSRRVFYLVGDSINRNRPEREGKTLNGTRKIHSIIGVSPGIVKVRDLSCFCNACETGRCCSCSNKNFTSLWVSKSVKLDKKDEKEQTMDDEEEDLPEDTADEVEEEQAEADDAKPGKYVACKIARSNKYEVYMAQVVSREGQNLTVKYMREVAPNQFVWPDVDDIWSLPVGDVLAVVPPPIISLASSSRIRYTFINSHFSEP